MAENPCSCVETKRPPYCDRMCEVYASISAERSNSVMRPSLRTKSSCEVAVANALLMGPTAASPPGASRKSMAKEPSSALGRR